MEQRIISILQPALRAGWSLETSSRWRADNPALGQCSVTALVVQDVLGGELAKTQHQGQWHFYNIVEGVRLDCSASQFDEPVNYLDVPADRSEAFLDTSLRQYQILRAHVLAVVPQAISNS